MIWNLDRLLTAFRRVNGIDFQQGTHQHTAQYQYGGVRLTKGESHQEIEGVFLQFPSSQSEFFEPLIRIFFQETLPNDTDQGGFIEKTLQGIESGKGFTNVLDDIAITLSFSEQEITISATHVTSDDQDASANGD